MPCPFVAPGRIFACFLFFALTVRRSACFAASTGCCLLGLSPCRFVTLSVVVVVLLTLTRGHVVAPSQDKLQ